MKKFILVLSDRCSKGYAWKLWEPNNMETFAYDAKTWQGEGIGGSVWKSCFDNDYYNPDSDSVYQWGNMDLGIGVFYTRFDHGPCGPQGKINLYNYYTIQDPQQYE